MAQSDVSFDGKKERRLQGTLVQQPWPQQDNHILNYCLGSVASRAKTSKMTRQYNRYNPTRYKVKSKVKQNIKVQDQQFNDKFHMAFQYIMDRQEQMRQERAQLDQQTVLSNSFSQRSKRQLNTSVGSYKKSKMNSMEKSLKKRMVQSSLGNSYRNSQKLNGLPQYFNTIDSSYTKAYTPQKDALTTGDYRTPNTVMSPPMVDRSFQSMTKPTSPKRSENNDIEIISEFEVDTDSKYYYSFNRSPKNPRLLSPTAKESEKLLEQNQRLRQQLKGQYKKLEDELEEIKKIKVSKY